MLTNTRASTHGTRARAQRSGMLIFGGGLVKHHICNANLMRNGADYAVFVNTGQVDHSHPNNRDSNQFNSKVEETEAASHGHQITLSKHKLAW